MENKNFCIAPWVHLYVHPDGDVRSCCIGKESLGSTKNNTLEEIWNHEPIQKLRDQFLRGEISEKNCEVCIHSEHHGIHSLRDAINKSHFKNYVNKNKLDNVIDNFELKHIDVRFSNFCNFKCRMCGEEYSSSIKSENNKKFGILSNSIIYPGKTENDLLKQIIPHLEHTDSIYFAGGEPLIQSQHWEILEHLLNIGRTDVKIFYNTNLSTLRYKNKNVLDYWKNFKNIIVGASIDGWKAPLEYWRKGSNWKIIEKNINDIKDEAPHIEVKTTSAIGWPNLWNALEFFDYCIETHLINPRKINTNTIFSPEIYCLTSLPEFKKELAELRIRETLEKLEKNNLKECILRRNLFGLIDFMKNSSTEYSLKNFRLYNGKLDQIRGENFFEVFPEHIDMKKYLI